MREIDLLVIGAGTAGLAAAREAKGLGLEPVVVDENPLEPAWFRRQVPLFFGDRAGATANVDGGTVYRWLNRAQLLAAAEEGIELLPRHAAWGIFKDPSTGGFSPSIVGLYHDDATSLVRTRQVIVAAGAADVGLAFPGWELGGVLGGLGALRLIDTFGFLDARRMAVLGSGDLAVAVAAQAAERGVHVVALIEIGPSPLSDTSSLAAGTEIIIRHTVLRAEGRGEVERLLLTRIDGGAPGGGVDGVLEVDSVCLAIGAQPAPELTFMARCPFAFDRRRGGAYPEHDAGMRTGQPGVLVAGDSASAPGMQPAGTALAERQGRTAAISAAEALGVIEPEKAAALRREIGQVTASGPPDAAGSYLTAWHEAADRLAPESVHLCRCEQVSKGAVARAGDFVLGGYPDEVKRVSRAGMGVCQGRLCRAVLAGAVAAAAGRPIASQPLAAWRPPLRPIPIAALATEELTPFDLENELEPGAWIDWWFLGNYRPRQHRRTDFTVGETLG